jgi:hypothetical protein
MSERVNHICVVDRLLRVNEYRAAIEGVWASLEDFVVEPTEVLRVEAIAANTVPLTWDKAEPLFGTALAPDELLFCYFSLSGSHLAGRNSVSIETERNFGIISISFDPQVIPPDFSGRKRAARVLAQLANWTSANFNQAALACGPELDPYEMKDEIDVRQVELRLSLDWRCWTSMYTNRSNSRNVS